VQTRLYDLGEYEVNRLDLSQLPRPRWKRSQILSFGGRCVPNFSFLGPMPTRGDMREMPTRQEPLTLSVRAQLEVCAKEKYHELLSSWIYPAGENFAYDLLGLSLRFLPRDILNSCQAGYILREKTLRTISSA
jgi:hypothetical protein